MKDEGFVPRAGPDTFILHPSCFILSRILSQVAPFVLVGPDRRGGDKPHRTTARRSRRYRHLIPENPTPAAWLAAPSPASPPPAVVPSTSPAPCPHPRSPSTRGIPILR